MDELATRPIPWADHEYSRARNRPLLERPPLPAIGEHIWYRANNWDRDCELGTVVDIQNLDDRTDPYWQNVWHQVLDVTGQPVFDGDTPRYARVADPWPWLILRRLDGRTVQTWEARLRGSAGWLPLDWQTRPERWRLPGETLLVPRPVLPALNVPAGG